MPPSTRPRLCRGPDRPGTGRGPAGAMTRPPSSTSRRPSRSTPTGPGPTSRWASCSNLREGPTRRWRNTSVPWNSNRTTPRSACASRPFSWRGTSRIRRCRDWTRWWSSHPRTARPATSAAVPISRCGISRRRSTTSAPPPSGFPNRAGSLLPSGPGPGGRPQAGRRPPRHRASPSPRSRLRRRSRALATAGTRRGARREGEAPVESDVTAKPRPSPPSEALLDCIAARGIARLTASASAPTSRRRRNRARASRSPARLA